MTMEATHRCPVCGIELWGADLGGFCPACLLWPGLAGAESTGGPGTPEITVTLGPASSGVLAELAETLGGVPRVLLRDTEPESGPAPVVAVSSPELPATADRTGKFQLFGEIARGGMGAVLKARDTDLGRELAIKVLLERHKDKPEPIRRFLEEAQIGGQFAAPGDRADLRPGDLCRPPPLLRDEAGQGADPASLLADRGGRRRICRGS
jgi:hypothetical protein